MLMKNGYGIYTIEEKKKAAYALNLCTVSVSQILHYNDINVLEQEYTAILNNLNLEQIPKDEALLNVLKQILDVITYFRISEGDQKMVDLEYQHRIKTAIWSAIPSVGVIFATSNPIALGLTLATQVGTGYMNYRRNRAEYQLGKEKTEWQLKRAAIDQLNGLSKELFETSWRLAGEYEFPDEYRLTDQQIHEYDEFLLEENSIKRFNKLYSLKNKFDVYPPFWYQLGSTANSIYRNNSFGLDAQCKDEYRRHAINAFEKYHELNRFSILRHDILTSSWALEYIDLLDLSLDDEKQKAHELVKLAEEYSGNANDILELCAYAYLKINDRKNAAKLFNILVNNDYNLAVNAKILSAIYIQSSRDKNTREDALRAYKMLTLIVDPQYILPMPSLNIDLQSWMPAWEEQAIEEQTTPPPGEDYSELKSLISSRYKILEQDSKTKEALENFLKNYASKVAEKSIIGMIQSPIVLFTTWGIHFISGNQGVGVAYNNIDFCKTTVTRTKNGTPHGTYLRTKEKNTQYHLDVDTPENFLELLQTASRLPAAPTDIIETMQNMPHAVKLAYSKLLVLFSQQCELDWVETIRFAHDLQIDEKNFDSFMVYAHGSHVDDELPSLITELKSLSPYPNEESIAYALIQSMVALIQFSSGRCRGLTVRETNCIDQIAEMIGISKEMVDKLIPVAQIPYRILRKDITEKEISKLSQGLATVAAGVGVPIAVLVGNSILFNCLWWFPIFLPGVGTIITAGALGVTAVTKLFGSARKKEAERMSKSRLEQLSTAKKSYLSLYKKATALPAVENFSSLVLKAAAKTDPSIEEYIRIQASMAYPYNK